MEVSLSFGSILIHSHAFLDTDASTCFIDKLFLSLGTVTKATIPLLLPVRAHHEVITLNLIANPRHLIVMGLSWLETDNLTVDWCSCSITFPVRPISARSRHSLDSVATEAGLVVTPALVSGDVTILVNNSPRYNNFSTYSKRGMLIGYRLIARMISQSNSKLASIHHSVLSMGYLNPNLRLSAHIWTRFSQRASFNPPNHRRGHQSYL